jgi:UDP-N-acetylmuramoyl-tripeptide--D-alanyl-D-alanine ligase
MNLLTKFIFYFKKPRVIIITGNGQQTTAEAIFQVLKQRFKVRKATKTKILGLKFFLRNEILLVESDLQPVNSLEFLVTKSSLPILVGTHVGDIPFDKDFFAGNREKTAEIRKLAKILPVPGCLILNFDDETVRELKTETIVHPLTFGFQKEADFQASDLRLNSGVNFKINYKGNIVPVWLEKLFGKEYVYATLAASSVGVIFNLNLVEISQTLKNYQPLPGKMRLIEGVKHSWILDDSESATVFSMVEAIETLAKLQGFSLPAGRQGRKIVVLGDILGIGKYTIEAHEAIGERVAKAADLLFTFGPRAKFIAQGALVKGIALEKIFKFDTIGEGINRLRDEIREGDLILVDGSKEMKMGDIVKKIKTQ